MVYCRYTTTEVRQLEPLNIWGRPTRGADDPDLKYMVEQLGMIKSSHYPILVSKLGKIVNDHLTTPIEWKPDQEFPLIFVQHVITRVVKDLLKDRRAIQDRVFTLCRQPITSRDDIRSLRDKLIIAVRMQEISQLESPGERD